MRSRLMPLFWLLLFASPCPAATIFVNQRSPGPAHDGTSWATAFTTVQAAVDAAQPGDEVWVTAGIYRENLSIRKEMALYGGFSGTEAHRDQRDWSRNVTVLDGDSRKSVVAINTYISPGPVTVDGFTIQNGASTGSGGGIFIAADATIANNAIIGNASLNRGGGIEAGNGTVTIVNNLIAGNISDLGGGISFDGDAQYTVVNNTIVGNHAAVGGAICARVSRGLTLVNSLIAHNRSGVFREYGTVSLRHCNVYGNTAYDFQGFPDPTGTDGNISEDPKLSSLRSGLHLQPGSPCIDAGDDSLVSPGELDLYGKPRILGAHVDIGADESDGALYPPPAPQIWHLSPTGDDANDGASWARARRTLRLALLNAEAGDEVWVAAGTYMGIATLKSGVGLYGGFTGSETDRSQRDPAAHETILDGTIKTPYVTSAGTVLTLAADASSDTVVDGFTITHGKGMHGAGLSITGGSPTIAHNTFRDNGLTLGEDDFSSGTNGGGLSIRSGSPTVAHNTFTGNAATNGAAIHVADGTPALFDNMIANNNARYGGGICVDGGMPLIASNTITGNTARYGAGVYAESGLVRDNMIAANRVLADRYYNGGAGGIYVGATAVAVHNRILQNTANWTSYGYGGGGALVTGILLDNLLQGNVNLSHGPITCGESSLVSRNTVIDNTGAAVIYSFGGTVTDNLLVSSEGYWGVYLFSSLVPPVVTNNTIVNMGKKTIGNVPNTGVYQVYANGEQAVVANNIITGWGKAGDTSDRGWTPPWFTVSHNDAFNNTDNTLTFPGTFTGNVSRDPLFANAANVDYRLQEGSPCIDAGDDSAVAADARDAEGRPRIAGSHVDMGAYEFGSPLYTLLDAADVLRIAAGLSTATLADVSRLDLVPDAPGPARITVLDAARIARWLLN